MLWSSSSQNGILLVHLYVSELTSWALTRLLGESWKLITGADEYESVVTSGKLAAAQ